MTSYSAPGNASRFLCMPTEYQAPHYPTELTPNMLGFSHTLLHWAALVEGPLRPLRSPQCHDFRNSQTKFFSPTEPLVLRSASPSGLCWPVLACAGLPRGRDLCSMWRNKSTVTPASPSRSHPQEHDGW